MKKLFVFIEIVIYITFLLLDLLKLNSSYIKYLGILLCFVFTTYNKDRYKSLAMLFTLLADLFLLIIDKYYEIGLICFVFVQMIYALIIEKSRKTGLKSILYRVLIFVLGLLIIIYLRSISVLNILVILYFSNLLVNTILSYRCNNVLLAIGLSLFVCCDICVGLHNIISTNIIATYLMWFFYLPSQVLIVLS